MKRWFLSVLCVLLFLIKARPQTWQRVELSPYYQGGPKLIDAVLFGDTLIVMGANGFIYHTTDFFQSYYIDSTNKNTGNAAMSFANRQVGYITSGSAQGGMFKTIDGGDTWQALPSGPLSGVNWGDVIQFINPDSAYSVYTSRTGFHRIFSGGLNSNYVPIIHSDCKRSFQIRFINDSTGFVLGNDDWNMVSTFGILSLYKTVDYGNSWQQIARLYPHEGFGDLALIDDTTLIVAARGVILKSRNGGYAFDTVMLSSDGWNEEVGVHRPYISFVNGDTGFVAYSACVYKTYDAGDTWIKTDFAFGSSDNNTKAWFIKATSASKIVVGAGNGSIYKTETGGGVWSDVKETEKEYSFSLFPNPAYDYIAISVEEATKDCKLMLTDINGRVILEQQLPTANYQLPIINLQGGLYLIAIQNEKGRVVKRFVKE